MKHFSLDEFTANEDAEPYMAEVVLDLEAGTTTYRRLPGAAPGDFPVIPAHLSGALPAACCLECGSRAARALPHFAEARV
jgi:hypothetical protein